ncbi:MAG: outer membrane protein assembly factor BamD [Bacteroidota bacterium]
MRNSLIIIISLTGALLLGEACTPEYKQYTQWSRKGTISQKDSAAFYFYNRGDYEKASFLFEDLQNAYRGGERAKTILYHYAYSKYKFGLYVVAAYYFEQFTKLYPSDDLTAECSFMIGYCYYLESAPHYLDQTFTDKAISQFQLFVNNYPKSDKVDECNKLMTELRERKAKKAFESAKLYYKVGNHRAAVTALKVLIQEFSDSRYREEAMYLLFRSSVELADVSVNSKKKNRYLDALDYYTSFVDRYPNSVYLKEAEAVYMKAQKSLEKFVQS